MPTGIEMTLPGFELLYSSVQSQLRSPQDAVVSAIHWNIISAGFKLTGIGENPSSGGRLCTETLPEGWNTKEIYVLHYKAIDNKSAQNYVLKIIPVDGSLLLHFQKENDENVSTLELSVEEFASEDLSSVLTTFRNMDKLNKAVNQKLVKPVMGNTSSEETHRTHSTSSTAEKSKEKKKSKNKPLLVEDERPGYQPLLPAWVGPQARDPFSVGRADLDPLAGMSGIGGGGMIMDPRHTGSPRYGPDTSGGSHGRGRGGLPVGAVPPGARFDPFGPPGTRPGPDPDHERPPSNYDDMFM